MIEGVPDVGGRGVTEALDVPTIGIGAGPACDGQVLVFHDLLGLGTRQAAKFVRQYADLAEIATEALAAFAADVRSGAFPSRRELRASHELRQALEADAVDRRPDRSRVALH